MSIPLVVGLPCHRRQWCLDRWFDSVEAQDLPEGTRFLFMLSKPGDPSERIILRRRPDAEILYAEGLPSFGEHEKDDPRRYAVLAHLRNKLLRAVCSLGPRLYLSWDSDILLAPGAFGEMAALWGILTQDAIAVAVGALVDMGGEVYPGNWSFMALDGTDARRYGEVATGAVLLKLRAAPVGVIMGVKLMGSAAYQNVRYADHPLGEDVGWAIQAEAMGVELWLCPKARGEHLYRIS